MEKFKEMYGWWKSSKLVEKFKENLIECMVGGKVQRNVRLVERLKEMYSRWESSKKCMVQPLVGGKLQCW